MPTGEVALALADTAPPSFPMPVSSLHIKIKRVSGIEPPSSAWKAEVLPLNYTRA